MFIIEALNRSCQSYIEENISFDEHVDLGNGIDPLFKFFEYEDNAIYNSGQDKKYVIKELAREGYLQGDDYQFI